MTVLSLAIEFVLATGLVGGTESQTARLAIELARRGHRPRLVFLQAVGPIVEEARDAGIPVVTVRDTGPRLGSGLRSLADYRAFGRRRRDHPDVVHAMMDGAIAASRALAPTSAPVHVAGIRGRRVVSGPRARLLTRNLTAADAIVCNARHLAEEVGREFDVPQDRIHVIPNGIDLPAEPADPRAEPATGIVIANFHPYKGHRLLVEALRLLDDPPLVRLCGTGPELEDVRHAATACGVAPAIQFIDPPADVARELDRSQFAVHPSSTEGLSNAILEEMAAGLPVIACDVGGNGELVTHGESGLLVPSGDAQALGAAIARLVRDPDLRARLGARARERAREYRWERCARAHESLYARLVGERGR